MKLILVSILLLFFSIDGFCGQLWTRPSADVPTLSPTQSWEDVLVAEPSVLYLGVNSWLMIYSGYKNSNAHESIGSATSTDGITWTKNPSNPIIGNGTGGESSTNAGRNSPFKDGSTIYVFYTDSNYDLYRSTLTSDGLTVANRTKVINHTALPSGYDGCANSSIVKVGSTYHMLLELHKTTGAGQWHIFYFTSSDLTTWTVQGGELSDLRLNASGAYGGPTLSVSNGVYYVWYHAVNASGVVPTEVYYSSSANLTTWSTPVLIFPIADEINLPAFGAATQDQNADPYILEANGASYAYYTRQSNTPTLIGDIGYAVFNGTLSQLASLMSTSSSMNGTTGAYGTTQIH